MDQETNQTSDEIIELNENHYYITSGGPKKRFQRNFITYKKSLKKYNAKLEKLYQFAVRVHGKPDLIHAHVSMPAGYGAAYLGSQHSIPVIVSEHYSGFFSDNKYFWRLGSFYKEMQKNISGFYTVSPGFKYNIENKTSLEVTGVLPNPINTELFYPDEYSVNNKTINFVTTGNIGLIKGTDILLKAFAFLPSDLKWRLIIIGKPAAKDKKFWKSLLKELPEDRIELLEPVPQEQLKRIYSQNDIYIVSSRVETANVSMLEAMACGCYVITSKINAPETLVSPDVATVYNNTPQALAKCIKTVSKRNLPSRFALRNFVLDNYSYNTLQKKLKITYESHIDNSCI
ncbi:hypothetical protein GCM10010465_11240 [Actinomadura fibrosa]